MSNPFNLKKEEMHQFEAETLKKIELVKDTIRKISQQVISEHQCLGVVPGTFVVCGEDDYQYCSEACLKIAKECSEAIKEIKIKQEK